MATATPEEKARWPAPNYENPESRADMVLALTIPTMILAFIFTGLRLYGRGVLKNVLGTDDWIMTAATVRQSLLRWTVRMFINNTLDNFSASIGGGPRVLEVRPCASHMGSKGGMVHAIL
jgi:hypothetical protein